MKVFITGIAGFLGSHLAERMLALGHDIYGIDNFVGGDGNNVPVAAKLATYINGGIVWNRIDCCDNKVIAELFQSCKPDVLYHCAATAHEGLSVFSPSFITKNIFEASVSVFSAAIAAGVKRIVFMSSMARYGGQDYPFTEDMPPKPQDPYGIAKVAAEEVLKCLCKVHGVEYVIAVPHNIIGPRQKYDDPFRNVASIMANRMLSGKQPIIYGNGLQRRCFSPIDDVLDILVRMADEPGVSGETFNVGPDGEGITINELAEMLADIIGFSPLAPIYMEDRPQEVKVALCSSGRIREWFGYKERKPLRTCLEEMVAEIKPKPFDYHIPLEIVNDKTPRAWKERLM